MRLVFCYFCKAIELEMIPFYRLKGEDLYSCKKCAKAFRNKWIPEEDGSLSIFLGLRNPPVSILKL